MKRRDFLKLGGVAAASALLGRFPSAAEAAPI